MVGAAGVTAGVAAGVVGDVAAAAAADTATLSLGTTCAAARDGVQASAASVAPTSASLVADDSAMPSTERNASAFVWLGAACVRPGPYVAMGATAGGASTASGGGAMRCW